MQRDEAIGSALMERKNPGTEPWLLVFDLDGTLIDSSADLCASVNAALHHVGRHPLRQEEVASFVGDGAAALVQRALAATQPSLPGSPVPLAEDVLFETTFAQFLQHYREHKLDRTLPYPGVLESLGRLRARDPELLMAVLTNKPEGPSREICAALGLSQFFFANYGGNSFPAKKPDPQGLRTILEEGRRLRRSRGLDHPLSGAVMIGDSDVDVRTARSCGMRTLGCAYGLAREALLPARPDWLVDSPLEWEAALGIQ